MNILAQIIGGIALIVIAIGMQSKEKKNILLSQAITNACFMAQYFVLGAITGAIMYIVNTARTYIFYIYDKKEKKPNVLLLILFIALAIVFGIYTYKDIFSILPIIGSISTTYGCWQNSAKILRISTFIACPVLVIHDIYFGAYTGMLTYVITFTSTLVGFIKYDILKEKIN